MVIVDNEKCKGCGLCVKECPLSAIEMVEKKAVPKENCATCGICTRVCKFGAIAKGASETAVKCTHCPVQCAIVAGFTGACQRYTNEGGELVRNRKLEKTNELVSPDEYMGKAPLITAVGSGTNYPCSRPAPFIVQDNVNGVDVVTVVTEAPLSYSGVKVKIDTDTNIGVEGSKIYRNGKVVGLIETEEYGSKMLGIGGANLLTSKDGFVVARTIVELANGKQVELTTENKAKMLVQAGKTPIINGHEDKKMRVGCGSATVGLFARDLKDAVDEAIILDHHVVGLFSEHLAGKEVGMTWSGVIPNARKSTVGRYFGEHGDGWGGTDISEPVKAIKEVDMSVAKAGMRVLVTETTGRQAALFEIQADGSVKQIDITPDVQSVLDKIKRTCEDSRVSVFYSGGTGGSARAGVTNEPLALSKAVHARKVNLTIGGAQAYVHPGGGINFLVDVEKVLPDAFCWVPTPATVAPIEYTMTKEDYAELGGHMDKIKNISEV